GFVQGPAAHAGGDLEPWRPGERRRETLVDWEAVPADGPHVARRRGGHGQQVVTGTGLEGGHVVPACAVPVQGDRVSVVAVVTDRPDAGRRGEGNAGQASTAGPARARHLRPAAAVVMLDQRVRRRGRAVGKAAHGPRVVARYRGDGAEAAGGRARVIAVDLG